jgi:phosphate transport system permease protein
MGIEKRTKLSFREWIRRGEPMIWVNASAVTICSIAVVGLLLLLMVRGFGHFWPGAIAEFEYHVPGKETITVIGEQVETETVTRERLISAGYSLDGDKDLFTRELIKMGNKDITGADFGWLLHDYYGEISYPEKLIAVERREWGNYYGYLIDVREEGKVVATAAGNDEKAYAQLLERIDRALRIHDEIEVIEKRDIGKINYGMEKLRLRQRGLELKKDLSPIKKAEEEADIAEVRIGLDAEYAALQEQLVGLYTQINRDSFTAKSQDGTIITLPLSKIVKVYRPNAMGLGNKIAFYGHKFWEFLSEDPREANTEGGIFPAIFGTVIMVLIMSIIVTPFGVIAAVYLREYAKQGLVTRLVRIAVNNLAGVPSIVYGVFGLGFFIYFIGSEVDQLFFPAALPSPTFGTPGLLWASLTLALLTLPVVIVSTEEGLSRVPRSLREGSLALGATKAETLWRIVLPMTSPAMMTGLILAVARAAGEVAPLMLVGVVKLAPSLPVDGNFPYFHLDQKFMHLGFHIYDVGFQSPNVEAARPLVYATALLLVIIIALLNLSAVALRNNLREKYKSLEM